MSSTSIRDGGIGAVVGVIIGILLGAASVWFYAAKRVQAQPEETSTSFVRPERLPQVATAELDTRIKIIMDHFYLCGKHGDELKLALGMACVGFKDHARNYYHMEKLPKVPDSFDESLRRLFLGEEVTRALKELIMNPKTRFYALTHLQVRVVLSNLDIHTIGPLSLLPLFVTEFFKSLPYSTNSYTSQGHNHGLVPLTLWRRLSAWSMANGKGLLPGYIEPPKIIDLQIKRVVDALADVMDHFAKPDEDDRPPRRKALEDEVRYAVKFGYQIFSHSREYQFVWQPEPSKDGIIITPGLAELCDGDARSHWEPIMMEGLPEVRIPRKHNY